MFQPAAMAIKQRKYALSKSCDMGCPVSYVPSVHTGFSQEACRDSVAQFGKEVNLVMRSAMASTETQVNILNQGSMCWCECLPPQIPLRYLGLTVYCDLLRRVNIYSYLIYGAPSTRQGATDMFQQQSHSLLCLCAQARSERNLVLLSVDNSKVTVSLVFLVL